MFLPGEMQALETGYVTELGPGQEQFPALATSMAGDKLISRVARMLLFCLGTPNHVVIPHEIVKYMVFYGHFASKLSCHLL